MLPFESTIIPSGTPESLDGLTSANSRPPKSNRLALRRNASNTRLLGVRDIENFSIGRKGDAVRTRKILDDGLQLAICVAVDAAEFNLFGGISVTLRQTKWWVGEVECSVRSKHEIVRTVEAL